MRILVTGATGFLGSHLAKSLLQEGFEISILKRSFSNTWRIDDILKQLTCYDLDQCDLDEPFKIPGKIDTIIHTATCYGRQSESLEQIIETNTIFPLRLLERAVLFKVNAFFNTDTILNRYLNSYALSKKQFTDWGMLFASMRKIRFINIKLEHMYGPFDDKSKFSTKLLHECIENVSEIKLTLGEQKRDFIYISDVVSAYQRLLQKIEFHQDMFQEYELGTGESISIKQFAQMIQRLTQSRTTLKFGAVPYRENEIMESCANIKKLKNLGWQPKVDLMTGLKEVMRKEQRK